MQAIAEESRSQHENKARALKRLRQAFFLKLRASLDTEQLATLHLRDELLQAKTAAGRLDVGRRDPRFWPAAGLVLDVLCALEARVADAAKMLGISTGNLVDFTKTEPKVWEQVNLLRGRFGLKKLQ